MKPFPLLVYEWLVPTVLVAGVVYELLGKRIPRFIEIPTLVGFIGFALVLVAVYPVARALGPSASDMAIVSCLILLTLIRAVRANRTKAEEPRPAEGGAA